MHPDNTIESSVPSWRRHVACRTAHAVLAAAVSVTAVVALVSPPTAVAQSDSPAEQTQDLSALIRAVADVSAKLDAAYQDIAVKREQVNKSLVDLQVARVDLDRAIADRDRAVADREEADGRLSEASATLQDYSSMLYRQGTAPGASTRLIDPGTPSDAGHRFELLQRAAADQRRVVDDLNGAQAEASEREQHASAMLVEAEQRHTSAVDQRNAAESQVAAVSSDIRDLEDTVATLTDEVARAEQALAQTTEQSAEVKAGDEARAPHQSYDGDFQDAAKLEALARLADQPEAARIAQTVAEALPDHLDLGAIQDIAAGSSDVGQAAAGQIDAGSVENAVDEALEDNADDIVQQILDAIARADMGSAEQRPESTTTTRRPPANQSDSTTTTATSTTATSTTSEGNDKPDDSSDSDLTSSEKVEIVVDRALSQIGTPYAWGGGDANGPTLGIRDGGIADTFGDYAKVGFDCSGLMIYAFAGIGKALPHYTGYQYTSGKQVPVAQRQRGDMLFWPGHVALYLGDGTMVEAPQSGDVVKISPVRTAGLMPYVVRLTD